MCFQSVPISGFFNSHAKVDGMNEIPPPAGSKILEVIPFTLTTTTG